MYNHNNLKAPNTKHIEVLERAFEHLVKEGGWTKGFMARESNGRFVNEHSPHAYKFCVMGAINRAVVEKLATWEERKKAQRVLADALQAEGYSDMFDLNDAEYTVHDDIKRVFTKALAMAYKEASRIAFERSRLFQG